MPGALLKFVKSVRRASVVRFQPTLRIGVDAIEGTQLSRYSLGNEICYRATSCSASPNSARIARITRRTERTMMAMRNAAMMPAA